MSAWLNHGYAIAEVKPSRRCLLYAYVRRLVTHEEKVHDEDVGLQVLWRI